MIELRRRYSGSKGSDSPSFSRLPAGYQEVEWLMNKDGAYIETNIIPPDGCCFELEASLPTSPNLIPPIYDYVVFGSDINLNYAGFSLCFSNAVANPPLGIGFHMSSGILAKGGTNIFPTSNLFYKYKYENGNCWINDEMVLADHPCHAFGIPIDIFALRRGINATHIIANVELKLKPLKLYTDVSDIANLIPCYRISDRVAGMYDIVNDVFYTNAGTGEFLYGPDVHYNLPPEYQQVEYLDNQQNPMAYLVIPQIKIGFNGKIIGKVSVPSNSVQLSNFPYKMAFGWNNGPQATAVLSGSKMYWGNFNTSGYLIEIDKLYELTLEINNNNSTLYVDNVLSASNSTFNNNDSLYIFNGHTLNLSFLGKVYSIKTEGTENIHLIPCYRKSDDVAGMYDLVSGEFYTNAGTGEFEVGPLVI